VLISTDLDELIELCDRVAVLSRGRLEGIVDNGPDAVDRVGSLMIGASKVPEAA
jgi:simple sugar transport system ATP-binding protein